MSAPVLSRLFIALGKALVKKRPLVLQRPARPPVRSSREAAAAGRRPANLSPETPRPNPQSQSFSRSYGSILPTSLIYIVLSTRGFSPWRPDAVMSTTGRANKSRPRIFKGRRERTGRRKDYAAFPAMEPYRRAIRFQGIRLLSRKENSAQGPRRRLLVCLRRRTLSTSRCGNVNPLPFR